MSCAIIPAVDTRITDFQQCLHDQALNITSHKLERTQRLLRGRWGAQTHINGRSHRYCLGMQWCALPRVFGLRSSMHSSLTAFLRLFQLLGVLDTMGPTATDAIWRRKDFSTLLFLCALNIIGHSVSTDNYLQLPFVACIKNIYTVRVTRSIIAWLTVGWDI